MGPVAHEIADDFADDDELLREALVQALLHGAHHLHRALDDGEGRADRHVLPGHVGDLHVGDGADTAALVDDLPEQRG
jgi:hypothetical protein